MFHGPWLSDLSVRLCFLVLLLTRVGRHVLEDGALQRGVGIGQTAGSDFLRETFSCQCL